VRAGRALRRYKAVKYAGPDDLVFQSIAKGAPMRDNNILTRHIKPVARKVNLGWVNWQVLRRSSPRGCSRPVWMVKTRRASCGTAGQARRRMFINTWCRSRKSGRY